MSAQSFFLIEVLHDNLKEKLPKCLSIKSIRASEHRAIFINSQRDRIKKIYNLSSVIRSKAK